TFINVLLPAPFSPSSAWISPGSTTRSTWSLATSEPNRLVTPFNSSLTVTPSGGRDRDPDGRTRRGHDPDVSTGLGLGWGLQLDLAVDDVLLDLLELLLQIGRNLAVVLVERGQPDAVVLQRADVVTGGRRALLRRGHRVVLHRLRHVLGDARQHVVAVLLGAHASVGVVPDERRLAAGLLYGRAGTETGAAGRRVDDV